MTYVPSESERRAAAVIQSLAAIFFFIPPLAVWRARSVRTSPYIKYWTKVCLVWSLLTSIIIVTATVAAIMLELPGPGILLLTMHFVFCVIGGLSSYFNIPYRYWFVANKFCQTELGDVYGQLTTPSQVSKE